MGNEAWFGQRTLLNFIEENFNVLAVSLATDVPSNFTAAPRLNRKVNRKTTLWAGLTEFPSY